MIKFPCPGCQTVFTVTDDKAGKKGKCPKCQSAFTIPQPEATVPMPPKVDPSTPVEIEPCPGCGAVLTVAAEFLGADVECPSCNTVFAATKPGGKPKSKAVVSVPPPPPAPAASAFSGLGDDGDAEEDEAPKPKKGKGKPPVDEDEDDAPKKKKKGKGDDDEDFDDEDGDDYDDKPKGKKKSKNGLLLAAGIVHILFGLMLSCGGGGVSFCGGAAAGAVSSDASVEQTRKMANDPMFKNDKNIQEALKKHDEAVSAAKTFATVITIVGIGDLITTIIAIVAGIGCILRKPFGKLLTFGSGPLAVLLGIVATVLTIMQNLPSSIPIIIFGSIAFSSLIYAGFTIFAVIKGYKKEAGGGKSTKDADLDEEDADAEDAEAPEEEAPPPPKKSSKRKPVEEDEDDDLPPPPKKSLKRKPVEEDDGDDLPPPPKKKAPAKDDFAFGDDEDEAPKPKKKKPRRDDDD